MEKEFEKTRFCKISSKDIEADPGAFIDLVSKPKFVCMKCHRVSANKGNLCKPEKLKKLAKKAA